MLDAARILVVDDEPIVRASCARTLGDDGYRVSLAGSGEEALRHLQTAPCDLALLDLCLPGPCGLTVLRHIRSAHPRTEVVVVTGYPSIDNAKESIRLGALDYVMKPLDPDRIRTVVARALERRHAAAPRRCDHGC